MRKWEMESWPPERVKRLCDLIAAGKTYDQVAAIMHLTRGSVAGKLARIAGRGQRPRKYNGGRGTHDDRYYIQPWKSRPKPTKS